MTCLCVADCREPGLHVCFGVTGVWEEFYNLTLER